MPTFINDLDLGIAERFNLTPRECQVFQELQKSENRWCSIDALSARVLGNYFAKNTFRSYIHTLRHKLVGSEYSIECFRKYRQYKLVHIS